MLAFCISLTLLLQILFWSTATDLEDVSKYPNLFAALLDKGWSEIDLAKLASGNILRVFKDVEKVNNKDFIHCTNFRLIWYISKKYSESVKNTIEPIDDFIDQADLNDNFKKCRTSFWFTDI